MNKNRKKIFELDNNLKMKVSLCYDTTLNFSSQIYDEKKDPTFNLLSNYEEIKFINKKENLTKFLYFNVNNVHNLLYLSEKIILIDSSEYKMSHHFYLDLLINKNHDIVNYKYNLDYIKIIMEEILNIKSNEEHYLLKKFILLKVLKDLIYNYKGTDIYNINDDDKILKEYETKIEELNKSLESVKNNYNISLEENIEEIYTKIIIKLLFNDKFEYIKNIMDILDLESIDITENIYKKIYKILGEEETITNYDINNISQLVDVKRINFYYILLKYILKKPIYIYNIPLLYKIRSFIIKTIKNYNEIKDFNLDEKMKEKFIFILNAILDSNYYSIIIEEIIKKLIIQFNKIKNNINLDSKSSLLSSEFKSSNEKHKNNTKEIDSEIFSKLTFSKIIKDHKKPVYILKEVHNNEYLSISKYYNEYEINSNLRSYLLIYDKNFQKIHEFADFEGLINNVCEIDKDRYFSCTNNKLCLNNNYVENYLISEEMLKTINPSLSNYKFWLKVNNNKYIICSDNGVFICYNIFNEENDINQKMNVEQILEESFDYGIVINENIIALISNNIDINNNNILKIYNINSKSVNEIKGYSFINDQNGLQIITLNEESINIRILLCACKNDDNKNGILLIYLNEENIFNDFYPTSNFEVYCFCQLKIEEKGNITNDKKEIKIITTKYFLIGGFDNNKKKHLIKLYMINIIENNVPKIEFIKEVILEDFKRFEGKITCILQTNDNKDLSIACYDGNIYIFNFKKEN